MNKNILPVLLVGLAYLELVAGQGAPISTRRVMKTIDAPHPLQEEQQRKIKPRDEKERGFSMQSQIDVDHNFQAPNFIPSLNPMNILSRLTGGLPGILGTITGALTGTRSGSNPICTLILNFLSSLFGLRCSLIGNQPKSSNTMVEYAGNPSYMKKY